MIRSLAPNATPAALPAGAADRPSSPEEAAEAFERVLARQFAATMTKSLFEQGLDGEGGAGWMGGYRDAQRDVLTDALADHLVDAGSLRVRDLLVRNWQQNGQLPADAPLSAPADGPVDAPLRPAPSQPAADPTNAVPADAAARAALDRLA